MAMFGMAENQWQSGNANIISVTDAANPAIYLWLSYSLWE
jgi:hypothetical protein